MPFGFNRDFSGGWSKCRLKNANKTHTCVNKHLSDAEVESRLLRFPYVEKCLGVGETFTCPAGVRWQRRAVTGSQNMQIALHTMQTGECCSLHRTGQTRQPEKITSKDVALLFFVCRSENEMRQASELSLRQKHYFPSAGSRVFVFVSAVMPIFCL